MLSLEAGPLLSVARLRWPSTFLAPPVCRPLGQAQPGSPVACYSHLYSCPLHPSTCERQCPPEEMHERAGCQDTGLGWGQWVAKAMARQSLEVRATLGL